MPAHEAEPGAVATERVGWHRFEVRLPQGTAPESTLWLLCRDGTGRVQRIGLGRAGRAPRRAQLVVVPEGARSLHAEMETASGRAPLAGWRLQPVGRPAVLAQLVADAMRTRGAAVGDPPEPALEVLLRRGPRAAVENLHARYRWRRGIDDAVAPAVPCRVRRGPVGPTGAAAWMPASQTRRIPTPAGAEWELLGDDAQWRLERDGEALPLPAGWYAFEFDVDLARGYLAGPALYPDFGEGCLVHQMIRLPVPDARGRIRAVVMLGAPVLSLRFDPGTAPARFRVRRSRVRRLARPVALWQLLRQAGRAMRGGLFAALGEFAGHARREGVSQAAARLNGREPVEEAWDEYTRWIRLFDVIGPDDRVRFAERARALAPGPLISVLLPVYETPEPWLRRCLDSVLAQAYGNWELCIADDASTAPHVARVLAEYARRDRRVHVQHRAENGHIAAATNTALAMATGEFVALLDHDDELRPHALLCMAEAVARQPDAALLYSDEDKIDGEGRRFLPYFKPDWNPDLLLAQNYLCHLTMLRTDLARAVGGFRAGFEGSQDHDLVLRCCESLAPHRIVHVPGVLYHWRAIEGSTAFARSAKDYAAAAGLRAVREHLERSGERGVVEELPHGHYRVRWAVPAPAPKVAIIVPTRDRPQLLRTCVDSLLALTDYPDFELLLVDNQTRDPEALALLESLRGRERVRVLAWDAPFNYSALNNWAVAQTDAPVLCLLNNDIEVTHADWLTEMVGHALRPGTGAVGAKLLYPDGRLQHAGVILGLGGVANHIYTGCPDGTPGHGARALVAQNLSAVTAACLVVRREAYLAVGGLDERLTVAFNDIDFCLRLGEAGLRNAWTPFACLVHHESATRGRDDDEPRRARFAAEVAFMQHRWGERLRRDPAWNPNLSLDDLTAALAFPPRPGPPD